ncbi:hypothetical protein [Nocardioides panacisoli]|uniref:Uncharacterized protein n=1 Tax=Nocardioides panacisoli TaxID=627624 RepID=A0ABP7J3T7_9ACTN
MTPTDDADQQAPQPSPEDEAAVRRLLAGVREAGPVPPAVAARLDDTLAGLAGARTADGAPVADVVPLAPRRRRRAAALLVAAAAVVVGGIAISSHGSSGEDAGSTSADSAVSREPGADAEVSGAKDYSGGGGGDSITPHDRTKAPTRSDLNALKSVASARVRPGHLVPDLKALRHGFARQVGRSAYSADAPVAPDGFRCAPARYGHGVLLGVRYGGRPAVVAFRIPKGDTQVVEVLQCGTADVLRSTTIPAG